MPGAQSQYRGYMIQPLRRGEKHYVVNIFPMNDVHAGGGQGARPGGHDQLIKLSDPQSGMYLRFDNLAMAVEAGERKVDAMLRAATQAKGTSHRK
ncbi:MAG: hypothetical protein M3220_14575 [Chloroflexota bacterium]|nr:hypothetical protein [Chloroflexota bacterium]